MSKRVAEGFRFGGALLRRRVEPGFDARRRRSFRGLTAIAAMWAWDPGGHRLARAATASPPVLLVLGDSLSAEYGLPRDTGWVQLLAARLQEVGASYAVVNASISGETTSGGRTRLGALLQAHRPAVVVLQLGANDGLRGLPIDAMQANLEAMIAASRAAGARVLLVGMRIPPNYGRAYAERFHASFAALAQRLRVPLVPFLLDGFATRLELFQPDRIHPTRDAQPLILDNVWTHLRPLVSTQAPA